MLLIRLLLLMVTVPILELILIVWVHDQIGAAFDTRTAWLVTLGTIVLTGVVGSWLAKSEGLQVLRRYMESLRAGRFPGDEILDGVLILVGASLLLTPGYVTDAAGFSLLIPWTRAGVRAGLKRWIEAKIRSGSIRIASRSSDGAEPVHRDGSGRPQGSGPSVIDVTPVDPDEPAGGDEARTGDPGRR